MIRVGIIGSTGYAGQEIVRIYFAIQRQKLSGMAHAPILTSDIVKFLEICSN